MDEIVKLLDDNLEYIKHKIIDDTMYIHVQSCNDEPKCPYCHQASIKIHSTYIRTFQDLPIQGKKVIIVLYNKKMFCTNSDCLHTTFAETFNCYKPKAKKTNRLEDYIFTNSLNISTVVSSKLLKKDVAKVSKSTVGNILKKRHTISDR